MSKLKIVGKKGDIFDMLVFLITLTVFAIILFVFSYIVPSIADGLTTAGMNNSAEGTNAITQLSSFGTKGLQRGFFLIFSGLIMSVMLSSFFIRSHPIFIFLYIISFALTIFIGLYMGNIYDDLTQNAIFAARLADQTLIHLVMNNVVKIIVGVSALSLIIIFSKFSFGGQERV